MVLTGAIAAAGWPATATFVISAVAVVGVTWIDNKMREYYLNS